MDDKDIKQVAEGVRIDLGTKVETPLKSNPILRHNATQQESDDDDDYLSLDMIRRSNVDSGKKNF